MISLGFGYLLPTVEATGKNRERIAALFDLSSAAHLAVCDASRAATAGVRR